MATDSHNVFQPFRSREFEVDALDFLGERIRAVHSNSGFPCESSGYDTPLPLKLHGKFPHALLLLSARDVQDLLSLLICFDQKFPQRHLKAVELGNACVR